MFPFARAGVPEDSDRQPRRLAHERSDAWDRAVA
jgi:hypothetical protein